MLAAMTSSSPDGGRLLLRILPCLVDPAYWPGRTRRAGRAADSHVAHDAVRDLEHARDLFQRLRRRLECQQLVEAVRLVVDLVSEFAPAPDVLPAPSAAGALDVLAHARDDLVLALVRQFGVEHEQDFVVDHRPESLLPTV